MSTQATGLTVKKPLAVLAVIMLTLTLLLSVVTPVVAPLYFRQVDGPFSLVFREDGRGRITQVYTDLMPQYAAVKLSWYETSGFSMVLAVVCAVLFLSVIPVAAIRLIRSRRLGGARALTSRGARAAGWIILGICILNLLFLAGFAVLFMAGWGASWGFPSELHGLTPLVKTVLGLGVASAVLTVGALVCTVLAWKGCYWGVAYRAYYTVVSVAALAVVWFLNNWSLLGWRV